jgi:hypothetical protein
LLEDDCAHEGGQRPVRVAWLAPPPFAFQRPVGAASAVERVELGDVLVRQPEVEQLGILGDVLAVGRLSG